MINFIIIDSVKGQYTLSYEEAEYVSLLIIKREAMNQSWDEVKNSKDILIPIISLSADEKDESQFIEEDKPLAYYKLENGGTIFLHYIGLDINNDDASDFLTRF